MRFVDFLRAAVILFGGAASALAGVAIIGIARDADATLAAISVGWWVAAALVGLWLGRRAAASPGIARALAGARTTTSLPELEPGAVLFNRLWALALFTVVAGGIGVFIPQVPAIATGYALLVALTWRRQSAAVAAIEDRDGVRFYFDRSSPFGPPRLVRTPWARKIAPPISEVDRDRGRERASGWARVARTHGAANAGSTCEPEATARSARTPPGPSVVGGGLALSGASYAGGSARTTGVRSRPGSR